MPTYEFFCEKCQESFVLYLRLSEYEKGDYTCPKCKDTDIKRQISSFQTKTSKKS